MKLASIAAIIHLCDSRQDVPQPLNRPGLTCCSSLEGSSRPSRTSLKSSESGLLLDPVSREMDSKPPLEEDSRLVALAAREVELTFSIFWTKSALGSVDPHGMDSATTEMVQRPLALAQPTTPPSTPNLSPSTLSDAQELIKAIMDMQLPSSHTLKCACSHTPPEDSLEEIVTTEQSNNRT